MSWQRMYLLQNGKKLLKSQLFYLIDFGIFSAGLAYSTSVTSKGFEIRINGYNEKIHLLLDVVLQTLKNIFLEADESSFEVQRSNLMQQLQNSLQSVTTLCNDVSSKILVENIWTKNEYLQELPRVSNEDLQKFVSKFFKKMKVHVLVQGNITKNLVEQAVNKIENALSCEPIDYVSQITAQLNNK